MASIFETLSPEGWPIFLSNLPNVRGKGRPVHHYVHNETELQQFIARYDKPGRALYYTVTKLRRGTARCKENVEASHWVFTELDFKDHSTIAPEEIRNRVETSPYPPTLIVASGHGLHLSWKLNEAVDATPGRAQQDFEEALKLACAYVGGDNSAAEAARLLRLPGSHNSKNGDSIPVAIIANTDRSYEISDLVDFWLEARPIMPAPVKNETADDENTNRSNTVANDKPIDVDARLAAMQWRGPDNSGIHVTQVEVTASLISTGMSIGETVTAVLEATQAAVAGNADTLNWDWNEERCGIERACFDWVNKHPEFASALPDNLRAQFEAALAAGKRPKISRNAHGLHIRTYTAGTENSRSPTNTNAAAEQKKGPPRNTVILRPFVPFDPATLPPRQWLYGKHYLRRTVSCTTAPGGFGKSSLVMVETVAMATCRNLLGEQPSERLRMWLHNGEDSLDEMRRRLAAICQRYNIPQQELVGWLFMTSGNEFPLRVAEGYNKLDINAALIKCINSQIEENQIDGVSLDPLVTLHGVPESDNTRMDSVVRIFAGIADAHDCSIDISHHMRKPASGSNGDYGASDIRGASAIHDAVRSARVLNRMSERDAQNLSLQDHEGAKYFRVDKAKGNYSPAAKATWCQFVNVELPNGDDVGVVAPWDYPGQGEMTPERQESERNAEFVFLQLLDRFVLEGRIVSEKVGRNYAPGLFAEETEAKVAKLNKVTLRAAMLRLFKLGKIRAADEGFGGKAMHKIVRI
jgi:RecA-family ATPase